MRREDRVCDFCQSGVLGDEYHVLQCKYFMDLQLSCGITGTARSQFNSLMMDLEPTICMTNDTWQFNSIPCVLLSSSVVVLQRRTGKIRTGL